jgi:hypothetical protein
MQELADDTILKFDVNQTHTVARSVAPFESAYCSANVCCTPNPLPGVTDTAVTAAAPKAWIMVLSVALAVAEPPPDTLTEFTCGELALAATFTVTAIAG